MKRTRRATRCTIGVLLVGLLTVGLSTIPKIGALAPAPASAAPVYSAYHDGSMATHQAKFTQLATAGYRMISLSVYGPVSAQKFAAVWVKRSGPAFLAFHNYTAAQVNSFDEAHGSAGYAPVLLSATGPATGPRYAGVWEQNNRGTQFHLAATRTQLDSLDRQARGSGGLGSYLKSVDAFGPAGSQRFAVIVDTNSARVNHTLVAEMSDADLPFWDQGLTRGGFRPTHVTTGLSSAGESRTSVLYNDSKLSGTYTRRGLTSAQYQTAFNDAAASGHFPIQVDGAVVAGVTRFTAIFAKSDLALGRILTQRGSFDRRLAGFDTWMTEFMKTHHLRAGSLAIARQGRLVYARGFTWAEQGYPITEPTSMFRIASSSKPITSMLAMKLVDDGLLTPTTGMQSVLSVKQPNGAAPASPYWSQVTLDQLLCQSSGISPSYHLGNDRTVAQAYGVPLPVTPAQYAGVAATKPFIAAPGTDYEYVNGNFSLAGLMSAKKTGVSYEDAARSRLFTPLGVSRPRVGFSLRTQRLAGEVLYDTPVWVNGGGPDVAVKSVNGGDTPVAVSYGGWNVHSGDAPGGWVLAPADWVKVLSSFHDGNSPLFKDFTTRTGVNADVRAKFMWSVCNSSVSTSAERGWYRGTHTKATGGSYPFHEHNGGLPSTAFLVVHSNGFSFALGFNRTFTGGLHGTKQGEALMDIADQVTTWPTWDLFPNVGIPVN